MHLFSGSLHFNLHLAYLVKSVECFHIWIFSGTLELRLQKDVEWTFYPDGYHYGKRCYINGQRKGNCQTTKEITLVDIIGKTRKGRLFHKLLPNAFIIGHGAL